MPIEKEFGKLTADQLVTLLRWQPVLEETQHDLRQRFRENPERLENLTPDGLVWNNAYEHPIDHHLGLTAQLMGLSSRAREAALSDDPQQTVLNWINDDTTDCSPDHAIVGERNTFGYAVGLLWALLSSFDCAQTYGAYINDLVAIAREGGAQGDKALCCAIRVDPTVVCTPTAARRLSQAVIVGDEDLLADVQLAMKGLTGDQVAYLRKFRLAIKVLSESGGLGDSPTALARRLIELEICAPGPSAVKNAAELIRKYSKLKSI